MSPTEKAVHLYRKINHSHAPTKSLPFGHSGGNESPQQKPNKDAESFAQILERNMKNETASTTAKSF